ncbi:MAG: cysteine-S-conjugate beta-lyase [Variibacter sp.]|jgi:cystathionine beta-lyase|nr:cysteine-S-conjugate beta-lyase [Variibacter sp.]
MAKRPGGDHRGNKELAAETQIVTAGRDPQAHFGFVNPPVYHGSTVLYPTAADLVAHRAKYQYGRRGSPTSEALETALQAIEGPLCEGVRTCPSGLAAISTALLAIVRAGDHLLVTDSVYRPTRTFCDTVLTRLGVMTTYYDPLIGARIDTLIQSNTRAVFAETPGSQTFEMQDLPAIAAAAHKAGVLVIADNTWATGLFFRPLDHGADIVVQAGTKYIVGHSDVMLGTISANAAAWPQVRDTVAALGICVGPDDLYLAQRGLRTMAVRLRRHQESGLQIARWLAQRPEVLRVMHPALEGDPGHEIWKRDFSGASGLFGVMLKPAPQAAVYALLDALALFGMGFSWGGYESLAIVFDCAGYRTATRWEPGGPTLRLHIGLEDPEDLIADLEQGFAAMAAVA